MTFFEAFYSKAGSVKHGFKPLLPAWIYGAEIYNQYCKRDYKMKIYTGPDLSVRESWKDGDLDGAS